MAKTRSEVEAEKLIRKHLPKSTSKIVRELAPNQLLAAQLWSQGCYTKRDIAETCRMSLGVFCALRKDPLFIMEVKKRQQLFESMDKEKRLQIQNDIVNPVIREIKRRIHLKGGLGKVKLTTLFNFYQTLNNEMRLDSKDGVTSKTMHGKPEDFEMDDIQTRYRKKMLAKKEEDSIAKKASETELLGIREA